MALAIPVGGSVAATFFFFTATPDCRKSCMTFMKVEIEKILQSDEAAQRRVESAHIEAQALRDQAQQKAREIIAQKQKELEALKKEELEKIVSEAQSKAQHVLQETDRYLERLRNKKREQEDALVNNLLKRVISA